MDSSVVAAYFQALSIIIMGAGWVLSTLNPGPLPLKVTIGAVMYVAGVIVIRRAAMYVSCLDILLTVLGIILVSGAGIASQTLFAGVPFIGSAWPGIGLAVAGLVMFGRLQLKQFLDSSM
jgi:hypothetical protein